KKLVYLYLLNHAKTQPELIILAVNTFVKDTDDPNPLVCALAIRTMGCLCAEKITDYLCDPLYKCLRDENPYVRKTAALCIVKLYDLKPELVLGVVANTVAALHIAATSQPSTSSSEAALFPITSTILHKMLNALNECSEWGRITILNALLHYVAQDDKESKHICEHVVLAAVKVIMIHMHNVRREELLKQLVRKMPPPLVST
ncbi:AP-1 complex subunit beta-1, partial [Schizophyllum commune]